MKRAIDCLSFPSPDHSDNSEVESEYVSGFNWKKCRTQQQDHDFTNTTDNPLLEIIEEDGSKRLKKFVHTGKFLILIFFGTRTDFLDPINLQYQNISRSFNSEIMGISSNLSSNVFHFPLINSSKISKSFNVLDPVGGGVYPRDVIIIFDNNGKKRFEIPIRINGKYVLDRPIVQVLMDSLEDLQSEMML